MTTRIMTFNANGIRSAKRKGFFDWLHTQQIDVLCIQETKAQLAELDHASFAPENWHYAFKDAQKKGYSGVAIFSPHKPKLIIDEFGGDCSEMDSEARWIEFHYPNFRIVSLYLPSGSSGSQRQAVKYKVMDCLTHKLRHLLKAGIPYIISGDWNIVRTQNDIANWKSNQRNSGCLPEERAWLNSLFNDLGYIDAFREIQNPPSQYTWWSQRGRAREKNVGWRIDYQILSPSLKHSVIRTQIDKNPIFSDHAPLTIEYEIDIGTEVS